MNKAVVYARVSTRGQNPENQLLALRKYAEARGLEIVQFYVDVGQSGGKASRPELDRLMMDARRRKFNIVLVARLDRLARSLKQLVMTLDELRELGIAFVSLQEAFDTSTSTGILLFQVVGAIAEFERSLIRERIALGLERARAEGKTIGRPLGAKVDEQELRRLRSQGLSLRAIARQVGISHPTVAAILNGKNQPVFYRSEWAEREVESLTASIIRGLELDPGRSSGRPGRLMSGVSSLLILFLVLP